MAARQKTEGASEATLPYADILPASEVMDSNTFQQEMERILAQVEAVHERAVAVVERLEGELKVARENLARLDGMLNRGVPLAPARPRTASSSNSIKSPKGYWKEKVYPILQDKPDGLRKQDIVEALGLSSNVKGAQALSSALQHMKKTDVLVQRDGRYAIP